MDQESLDKVSDLVLTGIDKLDIKLVDKVDLLLNLRILLSKEETYTESIKVLQKNIKPQRRYK